MSNSNRIVLLPCPDQAKRWGQKDKGKGLRKEFFAAKNALRCFSAYFCPHFFA